MKKRHFLPLAALVSALYSVSGQALVIPQPSQLDGRVQVVTYTPYDVFNIRAKVGRAVLVQLEHDERLEGDAAALGMGDSEAWSLSVKGNNILFKPIATDLDSYQPEDNFDTNLIVTTNKRTYAFQLSVDNHAEHSKKQQPTYVLRFRYPDTIAKNEAAQRAKQKVANDLLYKDTGINRKDIKIRNSEYYGFGDRHIAPTAMYDDGRFTYLEFNHDGELPVVYKRTADGTETLINMHVKGAAIVVHELAAEFILRSGMSVLGIANNAYGNGTFNASGSTVDQAARIVKEAE